MRTESIYKTAAGEQAILAAYDHALATHWPPHEVVTVPTRYGDTAAIVTGPAEGPPLVLLHGAGSNSAVWAADATTYGSRFRVYAVDLIGEPGKSAPTRPPWDGPAFTEWLGETLDRLGLTQVSLLGISQGGWVALRFSAAHPDRVARLVLLAPGGVVADRTSFLLKAVGSSFLGRRGADSLKRLVLGNTELPPELDEYLSLIMAEFKPRIGALPLLTDEELVRLTMPVLLIGGDQDALRDEVAISARLEESLPDVKTVILPGVGHTLTDVTAYTLPFLQMEIV